MNLATTRGRWLTPLLLLLACGFFFYNLGYIGLTSPDEARYSEAAREMLADGDWLVPRLNGEPRTKKPPLTYWALAASYHLFGFHEWAGRLVSALSALGVILIIVSWGTHVAGRDAGVMGGVVTASSLFFLILARLTITDMLLCFFFTGAVVSGLRTLSGEQRKLLSAIAFFLFAAGGTLVKGPIALVLPGLIVLAVCAWERRWHSLDPPAIGVGLLVFFALATPWFVLLERAIPGAARNFLLGENIERFAEGVDHTGRPFFYYVPILILGLLPWTTLAPGALWQETRMAFSRQQRASEERFFVRAAAVWWLLPLIFFSIAATKLASYILPCFPGAGLLLGRAVARQMNQDESYGRGRWTWITSYAVLLPLLAIAATLMIARSTKLTEEQVMHLSSGMLVTGLAGGLATMLTSWRWGNRAGIPVLLLVHYLFVACAMRGHAALEPREEMRPVAAQLLARGEPTSPLVCYKFYKPAMSFYLRRLIPVVGRQELEQLLSKENRVLCVIDRDDESEILAVKEWHVRRLAGNDDCSVLEIVADTSVRASSPQGSRQGHLRPLHGGEMNQLHE